MTEPLYKIATELQCPLPDRDFVISSFSIDSRTLVAGALFFAVKGEHTDGHFFIAEAAARGAVAAVVQKSYSGLHPIPLLPVTCPVQALQQLARQKIHEINPVVVAVTGSVGKTTTKGFIHTLLRPYRRVSSSAGNSNSQLGLPLAIANELQPEDEVMVLEMGMSQATEIALLVNIAPPDIAVVTAVELAHAENFSSLEAIAYAKAEILSHPRTKLAILSRDIRPFPLLFDHGSCKKISFSALENAQQADARIFMTPQGGMKVEWAKEVVQLPSLPVIGRHNRHNFLAAALVARSLAITWEEIARQLPHLSTEKKRLEKAIIDGVLFIDDSYNACEASVKAALDACPAPLLPQGRRIAVLGDMLELGSFSHHCHCAVGDYALSRVDLLFCCGKQAKVIWEQWRKARRHAFWFDTLAPLIQLLHRLLLPGDVVLVKGSHGKQLWQLIDFFRDRELYKQEKL